ncbi:MAG: GHKL domain-containing protein [Bacteriovorax sp.]|nr:GHKL domain-containing protein [Bacteriovorax sp.]
MNQEKSSYINEQVDIDYVLKSKNSALAFLLVALLFIFLHKQDNEYKIYITIFCVAILGLSVLRILNVNRYNESKLTLNEAVKNVSVTALLNGVLWSVIGIESVLSFDQINIQILTTFIILIAFSAASIVTLSHKRVVFIVLNFIILTPQLLYSILEYKRTDQPASLWLLGYTAINIIYNLRQSTVIQTELKKKFSNEYDLKKSLEEVALSKKNLEEESIKTFHASRLSSLGEMAGGVAHEINNPLTIIQGMTKSILVHDQLRIDENTKAKLTKIHMASDRIAKIVKGMKIISGKNDQIEHERIKISKVLELSLGLFEERFKIEAIKFSLENVTDPFVQCNPLQVSQIIVNLMSNAIDAILKAESEHLLIIKVIEDFHNHTVDIRVINSGPLISEEHSTKIFEPFFSTKSLGKGTGLGLSISQTLAHSNGGFLSYEEYEGKVCFRLNLSTYSEE